jgi:hypothetical protein
LPKISPPKGSVRWSVALVTGSLMPARLNQKKLRRSGVRPKPGVVP